MARYLINLGIAIDQFVNAVICGEVDETLSARAHRMREKKHRYWGWTAGAIDRLFFWQTAHCLESYESELLRRQLPSHYHPATAGFFTPNESADAKR